MFSWFSTKIKCWYCGTKVKAKKAYTATVNTSDGKLKIKMCGKCGRKFDSLLAEIEEMKNEGP